MAPRFESLCTLLARGREPESPVAFRGAGERHGFRDFAIHVASLAATLERQPRGRWVLVCDDAYAFAVGLFALWHTDQVAVSPPNAQPDTLAALAPDVVATLTDRPGHPAPALQIGRAHV